jgi:hypothetical protein
MAIRYNLFIMRHFIIISLIVLVAGCKSAKKEITVQDVVTGNWLIVYPDHAMLNERQRKLYGKVQDSIVNLFGLKLISFNGSGEFLQIDSLYGKHGKWKLMPDNSIAVGMSGRGFDKFKADFANFKKGILQIIESVELGNESFSVVWNLKKIEKNDKENFLFEEKNNWWRKKPREPEVFSAANALNKRVVAMLKYYAVYFAMVSRESSYFSPFRVFLPFKYYSHGIGLKDFKEDHPFANHFFSATEAKTAHQLIASGMNKIKGEFPSGEDFVIEYSKYFDLLAEELDK